MAKPKNPNPQIGFMERMRLDAKKRHDKIKSFPLIDEKWLVEEKWPDTFETNEFNYGSERIAGKLEQHGPFDTLDDAELFVENHVPTDKNGKFSIRHRYLREHTKVWREWGDI